MVVASHGEFRGTPDQVYLSRWQLINKSSQRAAETKIADVPSPIVRTVYVRRAVVISVCLLGPRLHGRPEY